MKRILLVHTGGTLGMSGRRPEPLKPASFFRTVRQRVPELTKLARIEFELFSNVDSCEMQPEHWSRLAKRLHERLPDFEGCVVTHGTDTLAETASALSFMLVNPPCPVVLTGAQRPLQEIRSDARLNLIDAVTSALNGPKEVSVCFDSHLYRGNRVRKVSIAEYDAFDSPNHPVLGVLGVDARFEKGLAPTGRFSLRERVDSRIFLLRIFPGMDPQIPMMVLPRVRGVVVEAYGAGNFPSNEAFGRSLTPFFKEARARGVVVLITSQAHRNGVDLSLYESGNLALHEGAIGGGDMTVSAAVTKLMVALGNLKGDAMRRYLGRSVAGERSAVLALPQASRS
jgi:L-asparaginase